MNLQNRHYVVFEVTEINIIDFSQVMETSVDTLKQNVSSTQTFVKYEGQMPSSVTALTTKSIEYTHTEIIAILEGEDWRIEID